MKNMFRAIGNFVGTEPLTAILAIWCLTLTAYIHVVDYQANTTAAAVEAYCDMEIAGVLAEAAIDKTLLQTQLDELRDGLKADNKDREQFAVALEDAARQIRQSAKQAEKTKPEFSRYSRTIPVSKSSGWKAKTVLPDPY